MDDGFFFFFVQRGGRTRGGRERLKAVVEMERKRSGGERGKLARTVGRIASVLRWSKGQWVINEVVCPWPRM